MRTQGAILLAIPAAPPSANRIWRQARGRQILSREARLFYDLTALACAGKRAPAAWRFYRVDILIEPQRQAGDVDNKIKAVLDGLTKCGFWPDDKQVAAVSCRFGNVDKQGRTFVVVREEKQKFWQTARQWLSSLFNQRQQPQSEEDF